MRSIILLAVLAAFMPVFFSPARAACRDDADALAKKYGIADTLPGLGGGSSTSASGKKLAETGGVIAPPPIGDRGTVVPPATADSMTTAPAIVPQTANGDTVTGGKTAGAERKAAASAQAASLLQAAHHAGATGDEATCKQRLADARALLEKAPTGLR